jgi:hypothetical protein
MARRAAGVSPLLILMVAAVVAGGIGLVVHVLHRDGWGLMQHPGDKPGDGGQR